MQFVSKNIKPIIDTGRKPAFRLKYYISINYYIIQAS